MCVARNEECELTHPCLFVCEREHSMARVTRRRNTSHYDFELPIQFSKTRCNAAAILNHRSCVCAPHAATACSIRTKYVKSWCCWCCLCCSPLWYYSIAAGVPIVIASLGYAHQLSWDFTRAPLRTGCPHISHIPPASQSRLDVCPCILNMIRRKPPKPLCRYKI